MAPSYKLRSNPTADDNEWKFDGIPTSHLIPPANRKRWGKLVLFTPEEITLQVAEFPSNRIIHNDDCSKFVLASFERLRFPDTKISVTADYIGRLMTAGLFLNGVQYRFYHHSNSQLRSRSCFMRQANTDAELDIRIYSMGDFGKIMNVAKRAKRIGLLFSGAEIDYTLDRRFVADIPDIKSGEELFSDGCGLISKRLAVQLSRSKKIIFRGARYTPCVFQIRYLGYKGVLMLHPELDVEKKALAQFRQSMKKFTSTADSTFSAVDYSLPYSFGRLNNDIIVLLSSLGISTETLLAKQESYFKWITCASEDVTQALDFLSAMDRYDLAERALLDGIDDKKVLDEIRKLQKKEIGSFRKNDRLRARMIIHKSRLLFGVCDPYQVLREGEVHVRITTGRMGATTLAQTDLLVVRNPCLHPGDCLKLRAVAHPKLSHLVDCVVFASVGRRAAPAMSSGGDLDGDRFFICWDPDLVPTKVAESYTYPGNREHTSTTITRADLAKHFASYNNIGVARVASLHQKWARNSPEGALSTQCQELNALHSQSVDGARITIPERLRTPPESEEPYVLDVLADAAEKFASSFLQNVSTRASLPDSLEDAKALAVQLLKSKENITALSEYEIFNLANSLATKFKFSLYPHLSHLDVGALTALEKHAISVSLNLTPDTDPFLWNSLIRSDILTKRDLMDRNLGGPLCMQRLYSSRIQGLASFFEYLQLAVQDYTRKLLVLKTDDRFAAGIFIRGQIPWDEDAVVNDNVVVCSFMPQASSAMSTYRPCTKGYRLHCGDNNLQLYNQQIRDTFVFVSRPPKASMAEVATSIALQKISGRVQQQLGRVNKTPVVAIEIHVISNRDRIAHQIFDLRFDHVQTEEYIKRLAQRTTPYMPNSLKEFDWQSEPPWMQPVFTASAETAESTISSQSPDELDHALHFALNYRAEEQLFRIFNNLVRRQPVDETPIQAWVERYPPLVFCLLKAYPPTEHNSLTSEISALAFCIAKNLIRSANVLGIAVLAGLEKIAGSIALLDIRIYIDLLYTASLCIRSEHLVQEVLFVLNDCRAAHTNESDALSYAHRHALALSFDRAEEAADECRCDDDGKIRKQRVPPSRVRLMPIEDDDGTSNGTRVKAHVRIDSMTPVRLHSHVRLQVASRPEKGWIEKAILDGVVVQAMKGEMVIELMYPPPPEMQHMDWNMYNAGSVATTKAMMDAVSRLVVEGSDCCRFYDIITAGDRRDAGDLPSQNVVEYPSLEGADLDDASELNASQVAAVRSSTSGISLIWGPPGTGKTTVVVRILQRLLQDLSPDSKILVTASTHNAVDNVLSRFVALNRTTNMLKDDQILRVATDQSKVSKALQNYTLDARVGGDLHQNVRLLSVAEKRVKEGVIVFTTCAGAGLGILRKADFDTVIIDEASQVTEPCALIPLVKGCKRAVLVGDHVQLRPTVRPRGRALQYDVSLFERLYTGPQRRGMHRTMLNVQYRFSEELARFPSREFYEGKLQTGVPRSDVSVHPHPLRNSLFPWPKNKSGGNIIPTIFVPCAAEEDMGRASKSNTGQVDLIAHIVALCSDTKPTQSDTDPNAMISAPSLTITVLSPYASQVKALRNRLPESTPSFTIDSFQGRESDIIIFSTVRCNAVGDIGFVEDGRRLNVAWTRAKVALVVVGDRKTLTATSGLWTRAIDACEEVHISIPEVH